MGVVVQLIKAVTFKEGLELKTHDDLWDYINRSSKEHDDLEYVRLFANTNYLHRNFYKGKLPVELLQEYINDAKKLVKKLL